MKENENYYFMALQNGMLKNFENSNRHQNNNLQEYKQNYLRKELSSSFEFSLIGEMGDAYFMLTLFIQDSVTQRRLNLFSVF